MMSGMRVGRLALALTLTVGLISPASVLAAKTKVYDPPGKAGANEYAEVIPSSGGNVAPPYMNGGNPTAAQISKLGSGKVGVRRLARLGKQGAAAAQFAAQTAPTRTPAAGGPGRPANGLATGARGQTLAARGSSALSGVARLLSGAGGGLGALLPLLLALGLGAAIALAATRVFGGGGRTGA